MSDTIIVALISGSVTLVGTMITVFTNALKTRKQSNERLDKIEKKLDDHIKENEDTTAVSWRVRILRFDDDLCNPNIPYPSEANFMQALSDVDNYRRHIDKHEDFSNGIGEKAMDHIEEIWGMCKHENLFGMTKLRSVI